MNPRNAAENVKRLLTQVSSSGGKTLYEESVQFGLFLARRYRLSDPENVASDAVCHLFDRLQIYPEVLVRPDGSPNVPRFRGFRRTVMSRHIARLANRQHCEPWVLEFDESFMSGESAPSMTADETWIAAEELLRLLILVLRRKSSERALLLARWAGFSSRQLSSVLPYTPGSQKVVVSRFVASVRREAQRARRGIASFDVPENDEPLVDSTSPMLLHALRNIRTDAGSVLLHALWRLNEGARIRFLARLAAFWDCVIAGAFGETLQVHRRAFRATRRALEGAMADDGKGTQGPIDGDKHEGAGKDSASPARLRRSSRGSAAPDVSARLERIDALMYEDPDEAMDLLLDSPHVHAGLTRARALLKRTLDAGVSQGPLPVPDWIRTLLGRIGDQAESALAWLVLPESGMAAVPFRGARGAPGDESGSMGRVRYQPLVIRVDRGAHLDHHLFIVQADASGETSGLVYPRDPGDPTLGRAAHAHLGAVRWHEGSGPVHLVLFWSEEPLPPALRSQVRGGDDAVLAWIRSRSNASPCPVVAIHHAVFDPAGPALFDVE